MQAPRDSTAGVSVLLLLGDGAVHVKAYSVVLLVVGACNSNGLCVDPGVEQYQHVRVALHGASVGGDAACVLVEDDTQLERVAGVDLCSSVSVYPPHPVVCMVCLMCAWRDYFYTGLFVFWR
jgi:hypothetical protein